jgi:hypothetical protein
MGVPAALTMAQIYAAAGSPSFNPTLPRDHAKNRAWSAWWDELVRESVDGALNAALYAPVRAAWPSARSSEFAQSMRLDGGVEPDGRRRVYSDFEWWNEGWMSSAWCGRGDLQAPAFYVFGETFIDPTKPFMDEQMRLHRENLDACLHSFGGADTTTITPWVTLPGVALPFGESPPTYVAYSAMDFLRIVALFRSRAINEFMVWPSTDAAMWLRVSDAIDAAWVPSITSIEALSGSVPTDALQRIAHGDRIECSVVAGVNGIDLVLEARTAPADECAGEGVLWVAVECTGPTDAQWTLAAHENSGGWRLIGSFASVAGEASVVWVGPVEAAGIVALDRIVALRIASSSAPAVELDLVQVVHAPRWTAEGGERDCSCIADLIPDGTVDGFDLGVILTAWGTPGHSGAFDADLNGDGIVDGLEIAIVLTAWGSCPGR